ncbi:MAG TPA: hypothetical protein VHB98_10320 [Chloroflexota bacterium]|nr:hypothetical protein [Chloroflexota bacterium]
MVGAALAIGAQLAVPQRVYSVAEVRALLARHRSTWAGRVIYVRGTVTTTQETFPCMKPSCALVGIGGSIDEPPATVLWLGRGAADPFWTTVRRLPWIGQLAPPRQQALVAQAATYQIRLLAHPDCSGMKCYDAVLLDSAVPAPPVASPVVTVVTVPTAGTMSPRHVQAHAATPSRPSPYVRRPG